MTHSVLWYNSYVKQYTLHNKLNFTIGDSFCWPTLLHCTNYTCWRWCLLFETCWSYA